MTELEQLAAQGMEYEPVRFLIARDKVPPWGVSDTLLGKPLVVCETLMECVHAAILGGGWIVNPMPFEGMEMLPSDNDGHLLGEDEFRRAVT